MSEIDLFIIAAEPSADLQGEKLVNELLETDPRLLIQAVSGPRMRKLPISTVFDMENLQVMGFIDVLFALPKIIKHFFFLRDLILKTNPKGVVFIDYPGFNLRLERSLKKKGYRGKLIHFVCPTVWAWGKKRIPLMAKNLDLLITLFPFEKKCFEKSSLKVVYGGHPLSSLIEPSQKKDRKLLALFPGSRKAEIERNLPLQLKIAKELKALDPELTVGLSVAHLDKLELIKKVALGEDLTLYLPDKTYELMQKAKVAIATSGTATLELALHETPTVVCYAIRALDLFIAQKIFKINLPFYCIVNIIAGREIFPELFGPNLSEKNLLSHAKELWFNESFEAKCREGCKEVRNILEMKDGRVNAAHSILEILP